MVMIGPVPEGDVVAVLSPPSGRIVLLDKETEEIVADSAGGGFSLTITRWGCVTPGALVAEIYDSKGHRRHWIKSVRIA